MSVLKVFTSGVGIWCFFPRVCVGESVGGSCVCVLGLSVGRGEDSGGYFFLSLV